MAEAQYETRTRTVEEKVVVLTLTEDEADALRGYLGQVVTDGAVRLVYQALATPEQPAPLADTFEWAGIAYEYGVLYRDDEGDYFEIRREINADGTPVGRYRYGGPTSQPNDWTWTLGEVVPNHGPLTKVTA